jgi:hypothetical protein
LGILLAALMAATPPPTSDSTSSSTAPKIRPASNWLVTVRSRRLPRHAEWPERGRESRLMRSVGKIGQQQRLREQREFDGAANDVLAKAVHDSQAKNSADQRAETRSAAAATSAPFPGSQRWPS